MIDTVLLTILIISILLFAFILLIKTKRKRSTHQYSIPDESKKLLQEHVPFYQKLNDGQKKYFEQRVQHFLSTTKITGVKTDVSELDKILVAASAIIPIFPFEDWEYNNLNEVLLYPESFNEDFELEAKDRSILGMVGTGHMQNVMVLSQHELRQGFLNKTGKTNTAIHEFVHLVDKTDGAVDGIPENLMSNRYITPWIKLMHQKIREIRKGKTDIDPYGSTNEAEFFAVVSEYFFERPDLLTQKHPELYQLLQEIFGKPLAEKAKP